MSDATQNEVNSTEVPTDFRAFCVSVGVAEPRMAEVLAVAVSIKEFVAATLARGAAGGGMSPLARFVAATEARNPNAMDALATAAFQERPEGATATYFELVSSEVHARVATLGLEAEVAARLAEEIARDPLELPTSHDPMAAVIQLVRASSHAEATPEFVAYSEALGLDLAQRALLLGALEMLREVTPTEEGPRRAVSATAIVSLERVVAPLSVTLPAFALEAVLPALRDVAAGIVLNTFPLGRALLAQIHAATSREATQRGRFTHDPAKVRGRFCPSPFEYAQVNADGKVYGCCPAMLNTPLGDLRYMGIREAWNSEAAQAVRASILDGSFRHCDGERCGLIKDGSLSHVESLTNTEHQRIVREGVLAFPEGPRTINMAHDRTCNLACPSCRPATIALSGMAFRAAERIQENLLGEGLAGAERLIITGSGDPFASKLFLGFLRTFKPETQPGLKIQISTNGVLLTPAMWGTICHEAVDMIDVSIDAATAPTYALNRGGDFARLVENLHFMGGLLRVGAIKSFQIHFVVQANNYREMPAFVALGRAAGVSRVNFKELQDWSTYAPGEFQRRAVHLPGHPEHMAFLKVLRDPCLHAADVSLFDMGDLVTLHALG